MTPGPSTERQDLGRGAWEILEPAARIASLAPDLPAALSDMLALLAPRLGCGRAWAVAFEGGEPRKVASWPGPDADFPDTTFPDTTSPDGGASESAPARSHRSPAGDGSEDASEGWLWLALDGVPAAADATRDPTGPDAPLWIESTSTLLLPVTPATGAAAGALVFVGSAFGSPSPEARATLVQVGSHLARVAERQRARAVLSRREQDALSLMERAHEGVLRYDAEGRITYVNRRFADLLGLPVERVLGADITSTSHINDLAAAERVAHRREGAEQYEARLATADGREVWVLASAAPLFDADGAYSGALLFVSDISERRAAERDVRDVNLELERRVRQRTAELEAANAELEAFAYSVSHDLRAPLRAVTGFGEILREEHRQALGPEAREYLDLITANAERMGELIDDLLEFSRVGRAALRLEPIEVGELVADAWRELAGEREGRDITLTVGALPRGVGDRRLLRLVWLNLLSNAVKYTRDRPSAEVRVGGETVGEGEVRYDVRDNGVGFDMAHADHLFEVFHRLHRADQFEGTGVGLAIAQRIVSRLGGRMWADAQPDAGACFSFTLPAEGGGSDDV